MITHNQAKLIGRLKSRKRREERRFLVEGVRLVETLIDCQLAVEFFVASPALAETARGRRLRETLEAVGSPFFEVGDAELRRLADTENPQGVLAVAHEPERSLSRFQAPQLSCVLIFDRLADPGNLGTLVRAGHALGVSLAVALPGTVDPWSPKVVRASAGSLFRLPVAQEPWSDVAAWLRRHDFAIFCGDRAGEPVGRGGEAPGRFALVLGNEPSGLSEDVRADCDKLLAIELPGGMDSLNVAVAGAILLDRLLSRPSGT
ncbi:MAG: RNA methyltransferase [Gemmatimonadota bacterium]|nr:MAG: RNA methyltransferase [Gemmatimonadota bacterium]